MNPKVKNLLKVFGISIGIVSGACAIIMGGLFLFGAFNKAHIPLDSMHFVVNDVYHEIELGKSQDMYHGYLLYKSVKDLRMKRRQAKDENDLLKDMYDYIKSQPGQSFKSKIQSIQGNSVKVYDAQNRRTYTPRQRNDLTITNKTCEVNRPFEDLMREFKKDKVTMQGGKLRK